MALENFISTIESEKFITERDKQLVLGASCVTDFIGEAKEEGDSVRVKVGSKVTVYLYKLDNTYTEGQIATGQKAGKGLDIISNGLQDAEDLSGAEVIIPINRVATFNYRIKDVEIERSGDKGKKTIDKARISASYETALQQDGEIAKAISGFTKALINDTKSGISTNHVVTVCNGTVANKTNILDFVDIVVQLLQENDVKDREPLVCECSYKFARLLKKELRDVGTDNTTLLNGRAVKSFDNVKIVPTSSTTVNSQEYCFIRTENSVAFISGRTSTENVRASKGFSEEVRGYNIYDVAIIDPKALIVAKIAY